MKRYGLQPATPEAYALLHRGAIAMARIEATGLRIDTAYLQTAIDSTKKRIAELEDGLKDSIEYRTWAKHYGNDMKLNAKGQLGKIIFDVLGHKRNPFMGGRNNVAAFEHLKLPFIRNFQELARLKKALSTNLYGIQRETVNGYCHPFWDLHTAESYRPSSSRPNLQNQPVRAKDIAEIARSCVIPREGHVFLEVDYNTQEVRVAYCYNKDENLRYDILNGDMHRDRSYDVYMLSPEEMGPTDQGMGKLIRYVTKNKFVFAEFYGSYYVQRAPELWDAISIFDLTRTDGLSLFEHLKAKGIKALGRCDPECESVPGTFEHHIRKVERYMWETRYPTYDRWRDYWWELYLKQGGVNTLTGFCMEGVFRRNQILCDPIQGSAFHCLLWGVIQIQEEFIRRKMRSRIVNQVHDSMLIDAHRNELGDVIEIVTRYALKGVMARWKWITIPLGIEFEIAEENWFKKRPLEVAA